MHYTIVAAKPVIGPDVQLGVFVSDSDVAIVASIVAERRAGRRRGVLLVDGWPDHPGSPTYVQEECARICTEADLQARIVEKLKV